jgi:hypothetical protein
MSNKKTKENISSEIPAELKAAELTPPVENSAPPADQPAATLVDMEKLSADLGDLPEKQAHAIQAHFDKETEIKKEFINLIDIQGRTFDPALHCTIQDKTTGDLIPLLSKTGKLQIKRIRGANKPKTGKISTGMEAIQNDDLNKQKARAAGIATANLLIASCTAIFGDDWKASSEDQNSLENAYAKYFEIKGWTNDIPPELEVLIFTGKYILPRMQKESTQIKVQGWREKIAFWWYKRKNKKMSTKEVNPNNEIKKENSNAATIN